MNIFKSIAGMFKKKGGSDEPGFVKNMMNKIGLSTKDHLGKESASRIGYYIFIGLIITITLTATGIEIGNAYIAWTATVPIAHAISYELIGLITLLMGQLSILLNIKKNAESTKFPTLETMQGGLDDLGKAEEQFKETKAKAKKKGE